MEGGSAAGGEEVVPRRCLQPAWPASAGGVRGDRLLLIIRSRAGGLGAVRQPERGAAAGTGRSTGEGEGRLPPAAGVG